MKPLVKLTLVSLFAFTSHTILAQVEKGDNNLTANLTLATPTGVDDAFGVFMFNANYGRFLSDKFELGALMTVLGTTGDEGSTNVGFGVFANFNFLTSGGKVLPYLGGQIFSLQAEEADEPNVTAGINAGMKIFINEKMFVNNRLDYGTVVSPSESEGGLLSLTAGFGFIF